MRPVRERIAYLLVGLILVGMPVGMIGSQHGKYPLFPPIRVIDIVAATPEAGGFKPAAITVQAGETITLRFSAVGTTHGVAIGPALGIDLGVLEPGQTKEVTLTFGESGTYTFYCNIVCSANHWRMRGVVEVRGISGEVPAPQRDPVIDRLIADGVDIDAAAMADHTDTGHTSDSHDEPMPSADRGAKLVDSLAVPAELKDLNWRRTHSPAQAIELLESANPTADQSDLVDVIAFLWRPETSAETLSRAEELYTKNCVACHGPIGDGNGPLASLNPKQPVSFADLNHMLSMRSDVLYAKIRRGGMGTGMPNFGTLFTVDESWALVDYLWTLALKEHTEQ